MQATRVTSMISMIFVIVLIVSTLGCGSASVSDAKDHPPTGPDGVPELTDEIIHERINGVRIWEIPEENGTAQPISWGFFAEEPKEITVVEKRVEGTKATIVLGIKTMSTPRAREPRYVAGQIRTEWALKTGWVLRKWEIVDAENISMNYRNIPKDPRPTPDNPSLP